MWQQFFDLAVLPRRQASQYVLQIRIRIMPLELGTLNQAHHRSRTLARTQGAGEQPVLSRCRLTNVFLVGAKPVPQTGRICPAKA